MATINFGKTPSATKPASPMKEDSKKPYYPSVYVTDINGADDLPTGEFTFTAKGKVVSKTLRERDGKKSQDIEIEVHEITPAGGKSKAKDSGDGLDSALDDIASKKQETDAEEADEEASGMDNDAEEADEK